VQSRLAVEAERLGGGGVVAPTLEDVQVVGVIDGRDDGCAAGGQAGGSVRLRELVSVAHVRIRVFFEHDRIPSYSGA
jgi:hypothetical protein